MRQQTIKKTAMTNTKIQSKAKLKILCLSLLSSLGLLYLASFSTFLWAKTDNSKVPSEFFSNINHISAQFLQSSVNPMNNELQYFTGSFKLAKQDDKLQFRFEYLKPTKQVVIGTGRFIYMVDYELEQITRYSQDISQIPLVQIINNPQFQKLQTQMQGEQKLEYFKIDRENSKDTGQQEVVLIFADSRLSQVLSQDTLGNLIKFELNEVSINEPFGSESFELKNENNFEIIRVQ